MLNIKHAWPLIKQAKEIFSKEATIQVRKVVYQQLLAVDTKTASFLSRSPCSLKESDWHMFHVSCFRLSHSSSNFRSLYVSEPLPSLSLVSCLSRSLSLRVGVSLSPFSRVLSYLACCRNARSRRTAR